MMGGKGVLGERGAAAQTIRLQGRNLVGTEHVKVGAFHTLQLDLHRPCTITKPEWDSLDIKRLQEAADPAASADLAIVLVAVRTLRRPSPPPPQGKKI
jgi:protein pelota